MGVQVKLIEEPNCMEILFENIGVIIFSEKKPKR